MAKAKTQAELNRVALYALRRCCHPHAGPLSALFMAAWWRAGDIVSTWWDDRPAGALYHHRIDRVPPQR